MKKILILLAFVSTMFMVSCEKDDIVPDNTSNPTDTTTNVVDLVVEVTHTDVTSFGDNDGTITVTVKTGNPPYNFILDGDTKNTSSDDSFTFSELAANDYKIEVKDSENKVFNDSITINQPDETFADLVINITVTHNEFDNNSGEIEVNVTGGKEPYEFSIDSVNWGNDNVFTNLGGGTYTVIVKDDRDVEVSENVNLMFGFDINVSVVHSNTHTDDGGEISINPTVTNVGNSPYTFSIDGVNWTNDNVFNNVTPDTYTVYAKDKFETIREKIVTVENNYNGYRVGDEYNKDGYVGVVFEVLGNDVIIADKQHFGINMSYGQHTGARLIQINEQVTNGEWNLMDIEILETYLNVAKDYIDSGNIFNVEVYVDQNFKRNRYWSTTIHQDMDAWKRVSYIEFKNGNYEVTEYDVEVISYTANMRGRYWATRPNNKN